MKVTIVVPARAPSPELATAVAPRAFHAVDKLAAAVGDALGIDVDVLEGTVADAPHDGYLLVFELGRDVPASMGPRIVALDEDRSSVMELVEAHELAGAVEKHIYWQWRRGAEPRAYGVIGRKEVAPRVPARVLGGPYTSTHYGALASDAPGDLVTLLAAYLRAYAQVVPVE